MKRTKFEAKASFWMTAAQKQQLDKLVGAAGGSLKEAHFLREALSEYLQRRGAIPLKKAA